MIIRKTINNEEVAIELTSEELQKAYYEQEDLFLKSNVKGRLEEKVDQETITEEQAELLFPKALTYFEKFRGNDESWSEDLDEAISVATYDLKREGVWSE